jgi:transcriptional regulator
MYIPAAFRETRVEVLHELIDAHPLGMLISHGAGGLTASPLPFLVYRQEGQFGTLRAHLAKANPHWQELGEVECLVVFQGEQGYVTPSWYPSKAATQQAVPTWNYAVVQVWGKVRVVDDAAWLRRQLDDLTRFHERDRSPAWAVDDAPEDYIAKQMKAIVGIEIAVARIEGKWKLSQNRNVADRCGVVNGMRSASDCHHHAALAELMDSRVESRVERG